MSNNTGRGGRPNVPPVDLRRVSSFGRARARQSWDQGDLWGVLTCMGNHEYFDFVFDNIPQLAAAELLEAAVIAAWISINPNMGRLPQPSTMRRLWSSCDRDKLMAAGNPLPSGNEFELYRGVPDASYLASIPGISWTSSIDIARKFAQSIGLYDHPHPAVFRLVVPRNRVIAYTDEREEKEFIVDIWEGATPERVE